MQYKYKYRPISIQFSKKTDFKNTKLHLGHSRVLVPALLPHWLQLMFRIVLRMLKVNGDDVPGRGILPLVQQALVAGPSACSAPSALLSAPPDCHHDDAFCHQHYQHHHHLYHLQDIWSYVAVRIPLLLSTRRWGREKVTSKRCLTHLLISTITTPMAGITIIITIIIFLTWLLGSSSW